MDALLEHQRLLSRRQFLGRTATGVGMAALSSLLNRDTLAAGTHFPAKAKRVVYLFMDGAPTHVDLFDYKPKLQEMHGKPIPDEYLVAHHTVNTVELGRSYLLIEFYAARGHFVRSVDIDHFTLP